VSNCIIWKDDLVSFTVEGLNSDEFKSGGWHENHAVTPWNLGPFQNLLEA
jgi:hypothetical protein